MVGLMIYALLTTTNQIAHQFQISLLLRQYVEPFKIFINIKIQKVIKSVQEIKLLGERDSSAGDRSQLLS